METPWTAEYRKHFFMESVAGNPWIPHKPHPRQIEFLLLTDVEEVLFGGAARGGKTDALLMAAFQFVEMPDYAALLLQKTTTDMSAPDAMLTRCKEWLAQPVPYRPLRDGTPVPGMQKAKWNDDTKTFTFPSGAKIAFGYLEHIDQELRYKGGAYDFVGFDELTRFKETPYVYLFSRLSRKEGSQIPPRMRAATNPGDIGHLWVKARFLSDAGRAAGRVFIPSKVVDNPSVDRLSYIASLAKLDSRTRKQLEEGDWSDFTGKWFRPLVWPTYMDLGDAWSMPGRVTRTIFLKRDIPIFVAVDWATSEKKTSDYTCFVAGGLTPDNRLLMMDCVNERINVEDCPAALDRFCQKWRPIAVVGEDDVLSKTMVLACRRMGYIPEIQMIPIRSKGKLVRWQSAIIQGENDRVLLPDNDEKWVDLFTDHMMSVTGVGDAHDDIADAFGVLCRKIDGMRGIETSPEDEYPEAWGGHQVW